MFVSAWSRCIPLFAKRLKEIVKPTKTDAVVNNFFILFITLGWLGMEPVTKTNSILARVFTVTYFGFFILMPWFTSIGKTKEVPKRVTEK
jgi:quinol-cytochrome oxidoreductase complex cytochrome b subunit